MGVSTFNEMEIDAIGEIMNISLGASATAVSTMLGATVHITTPVVKVLTKEEFEYKKLEPAVGVEIAYVEGLDGSNVMMFSRNDVRIIVGMLMGMEIPDESFELDEINRSAICEVMNQMMGSSATALSEFLGMTVNISTPVSFEIQDEATFKDKYFTTEEDQKVVVCFSLEVEGKLQSEFLNIMSVSLVKRLLEPFAVGIANSGSAPQETAAAPAAEPEPMQTESVAPTAQEAPQMQVEIPPVQETPPAPAAPEMPQMPPVQEMPQMQAVQPGMMPVYQQSMDPMMMQLLTQMQQSQMQMMEMMNRMKGGEKKERTEPSIIHPLNSVAFESDEDGDGEESHVNQEMLLKVPLEVSVEIGRSKKKVSDILEFTQGSLVVLDKMAGEQADLYVNGQCIAKGDIVVVEDNFGIRITEILTKNLNPESL